MSLRTDLIRLAHDKPEFRSEILSLLKEAKAFSSQAQLDAYIDSLETEAGKEKARKTHTVEEKGDASVEDKGVLGNLWQAIKDLAAALVGKKKEADSAKKDNTAMKKKLMEQVGWGDMNPDDVEFVVVDGDFGCQPCDAKGKDGFKKMDVSDADAKKAMASQNKEKKAVADLEKTQKEHDEKKAEAEKAEKKQKSKGKKPRENGELPIGDRGQKKKKREEMSKAELVKEYQEAIKKSDMSPEDKKKAIEQSKKPNFDPEAALGAMGDDDEDDGGKTAMTLRNKIIRLAYDKPELRKKLLPLLKQANAMPSSNRRSIVGPKSGKHRREWCDWIKADVQAKLEATGCPQSAIESLISRICGYQYGIMWDKGFYGVEKDKFTHFATTEEIKDWVKGKPYTETNFGESVRDSVQSYPKVIQEYIKSYGRSGSGATRDKAKSLYNKCKEWQIQVALVSGMSPGARSSGYTYVDVRPVVEAIDSYSADSLSRMIPWLEWAAKLPQPPEK